jgi:hypothetical protein
VAEPQFFPLLAAVFRDLWERPARIFYGLAVFLWCLLLTGLVASPFLAASIFLFGNSLPALAICMVPAGLAGLYFAPRGAFTYMKLMASDAGFLEAWAESGPNRNRTAISLLWTFLFTLLGTFCLVVPGIIVVLGLCLVPPLLVLENQAGGDTLRSSWQMMQGWKLRALLWAAIYCAFSVALKVLIGMALMFGQQLSPSAGSPMAALPIAPVANFILSLLTLYPVSTLFSLELYRALKANPPAPQFNWKAALLCVLLALGGLAAYRERLRLANLLMEGVLNLHGTQVFLKNVQTAQGEPDVPVTVDEPFAPLAPQAPFAFAWSGVSPGAIAVNLSGTVAVAGAGGRVQTFSYSMGPQLSQTYKVSHLLGLAPSATGEFYALGEPPALFQLELLRLGPDLSPAFSWTVSEAGLEAPGGNLVAASGANVWQADFELRKSVRLYDPNGTILKQGLWPDKDDCVVYSVSLAADQVGGLYLLADSLNTRVKPYIALRHLYCINNVPNDPAAAVSYAWDVALPVHAGDGYGFVGVSWEGVPYVADRHGLTALPGGVAAHNWQFELGVPLRGFAIDPWGTAHFLDAKGRMQRIASVAY